MHRWIPFPALLLVVSAVAGCTHTRSGLEYPDAPKVDQVDVYHGVSIADPYRWLEDPDSEESRAWILAENEITFDYLESIPERSAIRSRLTYLWDYERYGLPRKEGDRYFYSHNTGLQNQDIVYVVDSLQGTPRVLFDPNEWSRDGTVALAGYYPSEDGRLVAYAISRSGSDWREVKVRDVESGADLADDLRWIKFSGIAWKKDGSGFFYSRYDEPNSGAALRGINYDQKVFHHRIGTPQSEDILVYERPDHKEWGFWTQVSEDGRYLILHVSEGTKEENAVFYRDLSIENAPVVELLTDFDAQYGFVGNDGPVFWFRTDLDAPRGRLVAIDTRAPGQADWVELVPERTSTLRSVGVVGERFIANYLQDAHGHVRVYGLDGTFERIIGLPGLGSVYGFGGKRSDAETFYSFTSFTTPARIYRYDTESGESTLFRSPRVDFRPEDFETVQVFAESADGSRVPIFLTHRKGLQIDGDRPTLLYGYGGFNSPVTPRFSVSHLVWMEMGGIYASANLRGGGEYGRDWHLAGTKERKQNVFDDFIAAAEWLIDNGYTRTSRLAITGASNGGLLVGACLVQRPDLFGATVPRVGVLDMLRFHKFTIGWAWVSDYGSPEDPEEFRALRAYSPLHNIEPGTEYPATLIMTSDHDDRVVPAHSFKFAATLQAAQDGPEPILIRIETKAGHGAGKPVAKRVEEYADMLAFLVHELGVTIPPTWR
jgi:prolyl oligopeptidase